MDLSTLAGVAAGALLIVIGAATGEVSGIFLNFHGFFVVVGGTAVALLINTPFAYLRDAASAMASLMRRSAYADFEDVFSELKRMSEQARSAGLTALTAASPRSAGGYLSRAATTALEYNNPDFVREVLETEVNNDIERANEVINVIRTAGVLSPMFGLIGTLLGIVRVLQQISDPEKVGPAMALAITSALYGILLANAILVPAAGKLRVRLWEEIKLKAMIIEGVVGMMQGKVPLMLERKLETFK